MKRKMLRLFHSFKRANSAANWESYREARNEYQYALDKAEEDYKTSLTDSLSNSKNSKGWWHTVKSLMGNRSLPVMKVNTEALSDSKDKAEAFNNFFLSHSNIDVSQAQLPQKGSVEYKLVSVKASEQEVLDLLMSLDTTEAIGPDGIGPKLLCEAGQLKFPRMCPLWTTKPFLVLWCIVDQKVILNFYALSQELTKPTLTPQGRAEVGRPGRRLLRRGEALP